MNWSKAKTILIVVFLIADIFLFYETYTTGNMGSKRIADRKNMAQVVEHLEEQGIEIKDSIPAKSLPCPLLYVKSKYFHESEALNIFFDSKEDVDIKLYEQKIVMDNDEAYLEMKNNGELFYLNKKIIPIEDKVINEKLALKYLEDFLKKLNINENEIYDSNKTLGAGYIKMAYSQGYKNMFLDNTYLEIKASDKGVSYIKMLWFESVKAGKTKKEAISPVKALMILSEILKNKDRTVIEEISQGYLFSLDMKQVKELDVKIIEEGTAIPVWRIKTDLGYIYINAYNGTVEKN